jgi:ankyrin repeat protein
MLLAHGADRNARLRSPILKRVYNAGDPLLGEGPPRSCARRAAAIPLMMQLLLDGGAVPRLTQKNGNTPLMLSIRFLCSQGGLNPFEVNGERAIEAINLSLQHGVDVNAKNWESALHLALDYPKVMSLRAQHGADLGITDRQGRTVLDAALAAATPNPETIATLRSLNAPVAKPGAGPKDTAPAPARPD